MGDDVFGQAECGEARKHTADDHQIGHVKGARNTGLGVRELTTRQGHSYPSTRTPTPTLVDNSARRDSWIELGTKRCCPGTNLTVSPVEVSDSRRIPMRTDGLGDSLRPSTAIRSRWPGAAHRREAEIGS